MSGYALRANPTYLVAAILSVGKGTELNCVPHEYREMGSGDIFVLLVFGKPYFGFNPNLRNRSYIVGRLIPSNSAACDTLPPTWFSARLMA
jgi:hypothetical protein